MRKLVLILFLIILVNNGYSQRRLSKRHHIVNKVLAKTIKDPDFKNAWFGFLAIDANSGKVISSYNPDKALRPASNQKLISTASVLEMYGPDYQFKTKLLYTGHIDTLHKFLKGDIIIEGGGDPTLGSVYFDQTKDHRFLIQWTEAIKKLEIDSISGGVIADAGIYSTDIVPVTWAWGNMGDYFGAGPCGLSIFDNYYTVFFNTDSIPGKPAKIIKTEPQIPYLVFDNQIISDTVLGDHSNIIGAPYCNTRYLRGRLPLNKTEYGVKGSIPDPAFFAAFELNRVLQNNGIVILKKPATLKMLQKERKNISTKLIYTTYSPPLSEIIKQTNIHSINLFAEHFLDHCGLKLIGKAQTGEDAKALMKFWEEKGMDIQGLYITDGSGLSQYNAITPRQMVYLLNYMKNKSSYFTHYFNSLPIAGREGTVEGMFKGSAAEGNLRAKSGTIDKVKAYSGYVTSRSGREIIFSMMVNNFSCKSKEAKARLEKLMIALAELKK